MATEERQIYSGRSRVQGQTLLFVVDSIAHRRDSDQLRGPTPIHRRTASRPPPAPGSETGRSERDRPAQTTAVGSRKNSPSAQPATWRALPMARRVPAGALPYGTGKPRLETLLRVAKDQVSDESASALLIKGKESIFLSVIPNALAVAKGKSDEKQFSVGNLGACDSSKLPRLPGAEKGYGGTISSVYFSDMKVAATAVSVRNLLQHDGWQAFVKPYVGKPAATTWFATSIASRAIRCACLSARRRPVKRRRESTVFGRVRYRRDRTSTAGPAGR